MKAALRPFELSWSHYQVLLRIKNTQERRFYEIEAEKQQWTVRQLQRQYGSSLYERIALSRDKAEVMRLADEGQTVEKPRDMLKNPLFMLPNTACTCPTRRCCGGSWRNGLMNLRKRGADVNVFVAVILSWHKRYRQARRNP